MGYESKYFIVEKSSLAPNMDNGKIYAQFVAEFDMCKCYGLVDKIRNYPKTNCYFFDIDGNSEILFDNYDDELTETPIEDMTNFVYEEMQGDYREYRRLKPFYSLLKSFVDDRNKWGDIVVLHYGY